MKFRYTLNNSKSKHKVFRKDSFHDYHNGESSIDDCNFLVFEQCVTCKTEGTQDLSVTYT